MIAKLGQFEEINCRASPIAVEAHGQQGPPFHASSKHVYLGDTHTSLTCPGGEEGVQASGAGRRKRYSRYAVGIVRCDIQRPLCVAQGE